MVEWTMQKVRRLFGESTYAKGLDYYNDARVLTPVKIGDTLCAQVQGSAPFPYE